MQLLYIVVYMLFRSCSVVCCLLMHIVIEFVVFRIIKSLRYRWCDIAVQRSKRTDTIGSNFRLGGAKVDRIKGMPT